MLFGFLSNYYSQHLIDRWGVLAQQTHLDYMNALPIFGDIQLRAKRPKPTHYPKEGDTRLGALLKRKRLDMKFTQKEVANILGAKFKTYACWEHNEHAPTFPFRSKIEKFLEEKIWIEDDTDIAVILKRYRASLGLTQRELAKKLGVSLRTIENLEQRRITTGLGHAVLEMINKELLIHGKS